MEYDLFELERPPRKVPTKKFPRDSLYPYDDLVMNEEFLRNPTCNNNTQEHTQINLFAHKVTIPQFGIKSTSLRHVQRRYRDLLFPSLCIKRIDDETNPDNPGKLHRLRLAGMRGRQSHNRFNAATYQRESRLIKAAETFKVQEEPHTSGYRNQTGPHTKEFKEFVKIPRKKPYPNLNPYSPDYEPRFLPQGQAVQCKQEPQSDSEQEVASDVLENQEQESSQNNQLQQLDISPKKQAKDEAKSIVENAKKTVTYIESRTVHNVELQEPSSNVININQKQIEKKSVFFNLDNNPPELEVYFTDFSFSSEEEDKNKRDADKKRKKAKAKKRNTKNEPSASAQRKPNTNPYIKTNGPILKKSTAESLTDSSLQNKPSTSGMHNIHFNKQNKAGTVRNISSSVNHTKSEKGSLNYQSTTNTTNKTDSSLQYKPGTSGGQDIHFNTQNKVETARNISSSVYQVGAGTSSLNYQNTTKTNTTIKTESSLQNNPNTSGGQNIYFNTQNKVETARNISSSVHPVEAGTSSLNYQNTTKTNTTIKIESSLQNNPNTSDGQNIHFNTQNKAKTSRNIPSSVNETEAGPITANYQNTTKTNTTVKTDSSLQNKTSSSDLQNIHIHFHGTLSQEGRSPPNNDSVARIKMDFQIRKSILEAVSEVSQRWINFVQCVLTNDEPNDLELRPIALKMISETCDFMINKNDKKIDMNEQLRNKILRGVSDIILKSIPEGSTTRFLKRIHGKGSTSMRIKTKPSHILRKMNEMAVKIKKETGSEDQDVVEVYESNTADEGPVLIIGDDTSSDIELVEDEEMLSNEEMFRRLVGEEQYLKTMYPKFINICNDDDENIIFNKSDTKEQDSINCHNKSSDNNNANQQKCQVNVEVLEKTNKEKIENRGCNHTTFRSNEHKSENVHQVVDNKEDNGASRRIIESQLKNKLEVVSSEKNEESNQNERPCNSTTSRKSIEAKLENEHEIVSNYKNDEENQDELQCNATTARRSIESQTEDKHDELVDEDNYELEKRKRTKSVHTNNNKQSYEVEELPTIFRRNDGAESEANKINVEKYGQCNKSPLSSKDSQTDGLNHIIGLEVSGANKNKPIPVNKPENKLVQPWEKKKYKSEFPEVNTDEKDTYDESSRIIGLELVSFQFYNFKLANGRIMNHTHASRIMTQRKNNMNYQNEFYYSSVGNYAGATYSSPPPKKRKSPP